MKHILGLDLILGGWLICAPFVFGAGYDEMFSYTHASNDVFIGIVIVGAAALVLADMPGTI